MSWEYLPLKDLYEIRSGLSKPAKDFGFGFPFLSFSDVFHNYFLPDELSQLVNSSESEQHGCSVLKGDVFLTRTSEVVEELGMSSVALKDYPKATFNGFTKRLRPTTDKVFPQFIGFYLRSPQFRAEITAYSTLTTRASLNNGIIEKLSVHLPPLPTQKKIAAVLSAYDDLIENNNRRIALLEKSAEELYKEWFVRMRFPGYESAKFEKGIPEGWEVKTLDQLSEITSSKRIFLSDYVKDGIPFYRSKEVIERHNGQEPSSPLYISEDKFSHIKNKFGAPKENDILITSVGTLGIPFMVNSTDEFYFKDGNLIWFKSLNPLNNKFLYFWMNTPYGKGQLLETTIGSSQQAFTISGLKRVKILVPSDNLLENFICISDPMRKKKDLLHQLNQCLKNTRDRLLTRLISGKLSVENLDVRFPKGMEG